MTGFSPLSCAYRLAWEPALWLAHGMAAAERLAGGKLWPARWRIAERLGNPDVTSASEDSAPVLWLHGASLGEAKGLWAVAEALATELPARRFLLTTNTVEGRAFIHNQIAEESSGRFTVRLAPLDHPRVVRAFLRRHRPRALMLFEVELWPHFIREMKRAGGSVLRISALDTPETGWSNRLARATGGVDWTHSQSGPGSVDLRGLYYLNHRKPAPESPRQGVALTSFHAVEVPALVAAISKLRGGFPLFLFPRRMQELAAFDQALAPFGFERRSVNPRAARQIVDAFGLVQTILPSCRAAVVGGSFARASGCGAGHNLWEPLLAGLDIAIGPHHASQRYLVDKLSAVNLVTICDDKPDLDALHAATPLVAARERFILAEQTLLNAAVLSIVKRIKTVD